MHRLLRWTLLPWVVVSVAAFGAPHSGSPVKAKRNPQPIPACAAADRLDEQLKSLFPATKTGITPKQRDALRVAAGVVFEWPKHKDDKQLAYSMGLLETPEAADIVLETLEGRKEIAQGGDERLRDRFFYQVLQKQFEKADVKKRQEILDRVRPLAAKGDRYAKGFLNNRPESDAPTKPPPAPLSLDEFTTLEGDLSKIVRIAPDEIKKADVVRKLLHRRETAEKAGVSDRCHDAQSEAFFPRFMSKISKLPADEKEALALGGSSADVSTALESGAYDQLGTIGRSQFFSVDGQNALLLSGVHALLEGQTLQAEAAFGAARSAAELMIAGVPETRAWRAKMQNVQRAAAFLENEAKRRRGVSVNLATDAAIVLPRYEKEGLKEAVVAKEEIEALSKCPAPKGAPKAVTETAWDEIAKLRDMTADELKQQASTPAPVAERRAYARALVSGTFQQMDKAFGLEFFERPKDDCRHRVYKLTRIFPETDAKGVIALLNAGYEATRLFDSLSPEQVRRYYPVLLQQVKSGGFPLGTRAAQALEAMGEQLTLEQGKEIAALLNGADRSLSSPTLLALAGPVSKKDDGTIAKAVVKFVGNEDRAISDKAGDVFRFLSPKGVEAVLDDLTTITRDKDEQKRYAAYWAFEAMGENVPAKATGILIDGLKDPRGANSQMARRALMNMRAKLTAEDRKRIKELAGKNSEARELDADLDVPAEKASTNP